MIEDIVKVRAERSGHELSDAETLVDAQVDSPRTRPDKQISFGNAWIVEEVAADRGRSESVRIKDLIADVLFVVACDDGPKRRLGVEVTDRVHRRHRDVARFHRVAIIADPVRREASSGFRLHVERCLPTPMMASAHFDIPDPNLLPWPTGNS